MYVSFSKCLYDMMLVGIICVECKSGYGFDIEMEIKMLKVIEIVKWEYLLMIFLIFCGVYVILKYEKGFFYFLSRERMCLKMFKYLI